MSNIPTENELKALGDNCGAFGMYMFTDTAGTILKRINECDRLNMACLMLRRMIRIMTTEDDAVFGRTDLTDESNCSCVVLETTPHDVLDKIMEVCAFVNEHYRTSVGVDVYFDPNLVPRFLVDMWRIRNI